MGSKYQYYRYLDSFSKKTTSDIKDSEIGSLCIITTIGEKGDTTVTAFGKTIPYSMEIKNMETPEIINWKLEDHALTDNGEDSYGVSHITLTDNKSFLVAINYWDVDQRSWEVLSTQRDLNEETEKLILDHVKNFGFNPKHSVINAFQNCPVDKDELGLGKM